MNIEPQYPSDPDKENWGKAENPEVEAGKAAIADAQMASILRENITAYAVQAVKYGHVDQTWVNTQLALLGANPVSVTAEYRINQPVTGVFGKTVHAKSRTDALAIFQQHVNRVTGRGQISDGNCDSVYDVQFPADGEPTFYSGPEDPETETNPLELNLDGLKAGIRRMLKEAVSGYGWGYAYAQETLDAMGLEQLPNLVVKTAEVPVSGTATINVQVFKGDDDDAVKAAASAIVRRAKMVTLAPEEVGAAYVKRPDGGDMGLTLVDDDEDDVF